MDTWLSSATKLLETASENAKALAKEPIDAPEVSSDGKKKLRFGQGQLGFTLECCHVVGVEKGSQAGRSGVEVGDRLVDVDGRKVPDFEPDDPEGEQHAQDLVDKWLEEMPRPIFLTFVSPESAEATFVPSGKDDVEDADASEGSTAASAKVDLDMEVDFSRLDQALAAKAKEEALSFGDDSALAAELKRQQSVNSQLTEDLREQHRKAAGLWKQLAVLKAENKQVLLLQSRAQEESCDAMEVAQQREQALKDEMDQLRGASAIDNKAAAESATKAIGLKAAAAEERADSAEAELETLRRELAGLNAEHETELRLVREKQERWEKDACERFAEQERQHKVREGESAQLLEKARKDASGADFDLGADVPVDVPSRSKTDTKEVAALYDRIDVLQKRCSSMQKKMSSLSPQRPGNGVGKDPPPWAPRLISLVGVKAAEFILRPYMMLSVVMLRLTHLLLSSEVWRWLFFMQIVILYTIAASWYSQKIVDPASPIDELNAGIAKAASANAGGAGR